MTQDTADVPPEKDQGEAAQAQAEEQAQPDLDGTNKDDASISKSEAEDKEEEEEEEDDLLNSPAFLKQKLKVLEAELAQVEKDIEQVEEEQEGLIDEWAPKRDRLQTDFDNFRARTRSQKEEAQVDSKIQLVNDLLPMLDNFDRARKSISPSGAVQESVNEKYLALFDDIESTLRELGVEKIETVGQAFDYNLHMAIQQIPSEEFEEGVVCEELQTGYTCKGKLVRAAYVMVSAG